MSKLFIAAKIGPYTLSHRVNAVCAMSCTQCGLRGPAHAMPCTRSDSEACLAS